MRPPSINSLIQKHAAHPAWLVKSYAKELVKNEANEQILNEQIQAKINEFKTQELRTLHNCTGVILHTNLGRALISREHASELARLISSPINLEFNMQDAKRSVRDERLRFLLSELFGAEDALVVNNNAAAVYLVLNTLASGQKVVCAKSECVEIGGGFRISEVAAASNAKLLEVGASNKCNENDYKNAFSAHEDIKMLLKTHKSNFYIAGFSAEVSASDCAQIAHEHGALCYYDLGSAHCGILPPNLLENEPSAMKLMQQGIDILSFSGDKLFASTQAGIILASKQIIQKLRANHLFRMFRPDKTTLILLELATRSYLDGDIKNLPSLKLLNESKTQRLERAKRIQDALKNAPCALKIAPSNALVGGGSMPNKSLASYILQLEFNNNDAAKCALKSLRSAGIIAILLPNAIGFDVAALHDEAGFIAALSDWLQKYFA